MTAPVWLDEAYGRPGTVINKSEDSPGTTSVMRKLDLENSVYPTGGWTLSARDHGLSHVKGAKLMLRTPNDQSCTASGVCPYISINPGGEATLKLYKLSGSNFVEASNNYSGPAGTYLWLEFIGQM